MSLRGWTVHRWSSAIAAVLTTAPGSAAGSTLDREVTIDFLGASTHVRNAAVSDGVRNTSAVVDDLDPQVVFDSDVDGQCGGVSMPKSVADRFSHNGFRMIGQRRVNHRQRSDELDRGTKLGTRELGDRLVEPLAQPRRTRLGAVQIENRSADLLNDLLQVIHTVRKPLLHFR